MTKKERIESNLGLVHACANRFRGRGVDYEELYSTGCLGLVKAAENFDESRGFCFSTYAVPVILGEIKRIFRDGGSVKVSRSVKELWLKISRESESFAQREGRQPQVSELAAMLGVSAEQVSEAIMAGKPTVSLTPEESDRTGQTDIPVEAPDEHIADRISLEQVIMALSDEDRRLIVLRYYKGKTQSETAKSLKMSQVQVSRREKKILGELRRELLR